MDKLKIVYSDAVKNAIIKTLAELQQKLPERQFSAIQKLAEDGQFLEIEALMSLADESLDERAAQ